MVDIVAILGLFIIAMYNNYQCEMLEKRCKELERKNSLMELKFIDRKDLKLELNYIKSLEDFKKTCADFEQQCKELENSKRVK